MIYLDHAATTPLGEAAWEAMLPFLRDGFGNPSEPHAAGRAARRGLEAARAKTASVLDVAPADVVFTGGGSEADNLAVLGHAAARPGRILAAVVEHPAVRNAVLELERRGREVVWLPVDGSGVVDPAALEAELRPDDALVCVMWANNVTGAIQPVEQAARLAAARGVPFHADAVQAAAGTRVDAGALGPLATVAVAAHKLGGPKGVGALAGPGVALLEPVLHGGGQERALRPGTENVAGAAALAAVLAERQGDPSEWATRARRRDRLVAATGLETASAGAPRLPGHALLLCEGARGDSLVALLDQDGFCVAAGSACASGTSEPSYVLTAMGLPPEAARSALRVTLGPETTDAEVDAFAPALDAALAGLRVAAGALR